MIDPTQGMAGVGAVRPGGDGLSTAAAHASKSAAGASASGLAEDFADLLQRSVDAVTRGEQVGYTGVVGGAPTHEVVQAVMEAERSLQTALAVRNKVVEAYLEISRMQI